MGNSCDGLLGFSAGYQIYKAAGGPTPDCSKDKNAIIESTQSIVSIAMSRSTNRCSGTSDISQIFSAECNPTVPSNLQVYEQNSSCTVCIQSILRGLEYRDELQRAKWVTADPTTVKVDSNIDDVFTAIRDGLALCGTSVCKACSFSYITQNSVVNSRVGCTQSEINVDTFRVNLSSMINAAFTENQDVFAATATILGTSDAEVVTNRVTNSIVNNIENEFYTEVLNRVRSSQSVVLTANSANTSYISQSNVVTVVSELLGETQYVQRALAELEIDLVVETLKSSNSMDAFGRVVYETTTSPFRVLDSTLGLIVTVIVSTLLCVVIVGGIVIAVKWSKTHARVKKVRRAFLQRSGNG